MHPIIIAITIFSLILFLKYKWKRKRLEKMMNQFNGPPLLPIVGNGLVFCCSSKDSRQQSAGKRKDSSYQFVVDMLGNGIITAEVQRWKLHRQVLKSAFSATNVMNFFLNVFNKRNTILVQRLENEVDTEKHFDLWPHIIFTSVNTIGETAFGSEKSIPEYLITRFGEAIIKSSAIISKRFYTPFLHPSMIFSAYKYLIGCGDIMKIVHELPLMIFKGKNRQLDEQKSETEEKKNVPRTVSSILLHWHEKKVLSEQEVKDNVISFMFGGSESTAVTNCFTLLMLAMHPDIQDKVYHEIYKIFGDSDRPPTPEDLKKLTFLDQCIKETMRRFPIVPVVLRYAHEDIHINDGYTIPAGANIILGMIGVHHNPAIYPNHLTWNPHNFDPDVELQRPKFSFVPFSSGPRGCLGKCQGTVKRIIECIFSGEKYAYISMKAQISTLLRCYKFSTNVRIEDIELEVDFIIRSSRGYYVKIEHRCRKPNV